MKRKYRYILFLLLFALALIGGQQCFRYPGEKTVPLPVADGASISILKDQTLSNLDRIRHLAEQSNQFVPYDPSTSRTSSDVYVSCWIQLPLENKSDQPIDRVLEVNYRWVDMARLYEIHSDGSYTEYRNGENVPVSAKPLPFATHAFNIKMDAHERKTYFLYLRDYHWLLPSLTLWENPQIYTERASKEQQVVFIYMGLVIGLIIMNGCVFLALRDKDTLYYIQFLMAACALHIVHFNLHTTFLNQIQSIDSNLLPSGVNFYLYSGILILTAGLFLRFSLEFLQTKQNCGWIHSPALYLANLLILISPVFMFGPATYFGHTIISVIACLWALTHFIALTLGVYCAIRKIPQAYFFIPANLLLLIVSWQYIQTLMEGGIPTSELLMQWLYASGIEMIVLAVGLSERIRMINEQKEIAQTSALSEAEKRSELQRQYNSQLEQEVSSRTRELAAANQQKGELLKIIAHDIKAPIDGVSSLARMLANSPQKIDPANIKNYTKDIETSAAHLSELTKSLLLWGQLQAGQQLIEPQPYLLSDLQDAISPSLSVMARKKGIELKWQIPAKTFAKFDFESIASVIRNLVTNAIKYSPPHSQIHICAIPKWDQIELSVQDWGIGITHDRLQKLRQQIPIESTRGLNQEPGTGIGLQICQDILKAHDAHFEIHSEPDIGTRCCFYLKIWINDES